MVGVTQYTLEQGALLGAHHLAFVGDFLSIALGNGTCFVKDKGIYLCHLFYSLGILEVEMAFA